VIAIRQQVRIGNLALLAVLTLAMLGVPARQARAQPAAPRSPTLRLTARVDAFLARVDALHAGLGVNTDLGSYVRLDAALAAGAARFEQTTVASGRAEVVARFLLDPFRQSRWGFYGGGGLIARYDDGPGASGYLTVLVGTELPGAWRTLPALEIGIGGGTRIGLVIRRGRSNRR
jgi:hypothetical protein